MVATRGGLPGGGRERRSVPRAEVGARGERPAAARCSRGARKWRGRERLGQARAARREERRPSGLSGARGRREGGARAQV
jgi:hypothetical protein